MYLENQYLSSSACFSHSISRDIDAAVRTKTFFGIVDNTSECWDNEKLNLVKETPTIIHFYASLETTILVDGSPRITYSHLNNRLNTQILLRRQRLVEVDNGLKILLGSHAYTAPMNRPLMISPMLHLLHGCYPWGYTNNCASPLEVLQKLRVYQSLFLISMLFDVVLESFGRRIKVW